MWISSTTTPVIKMGDNNASPATMEVTWPGGDSQAHSRSSRSWSKRRRTKSEGGGDHETPSSPATEEVEEEEAERRYMMNVWFTWGLIIISVLKDPSPLLCLCGLVGTAPQHQSESYIFCWPYRVVGVQFGNLHCCWPPRLGFLIN